MMVLRVSLVLFGRGVLCSLVLLALASLVPRYTSKSACDNPADTLYIVNHGYHTGLILPAEVWKRAWPDFPFATEEAPRFIEFGWGDRAFYMARGEDARLALRALFTPTDAVMHVVPLTYHPREFFRSSKVYALAYCPERRAAMLHFIREYFQLDEQGRPEYLSHGLYGEHSAFYAAHGTYHCFYTCNNWVGDAMAAAGLPAPLWGGLAQSISFLIEQRMNK